MAFTPDKPAKNDATITNEDKGLDELTWDDADYSWDEADFPWDTPYAVFSRASKNDATINEPTKN